MRRRAIWSDRLQPTKGKPNRKPERPAASGHDPLARWAAAFPWLLALAGLAADANSVSVPFIFDDQTAVVENESIRSLSPLARALTGPDQTSVAGRPSVNLSFAINYAFGRLNPIGYHLLNLAIHVLAALALFGIIRRSLRSETLRARWENAADGVAIAASLLWLVHPLQSESVTYVVQRAESLMGLFYLTTLYAFMRGAGAAGEGARNSWFVAAAAACALGMTCKEVMATAPLAILLYDRIFLARSWREVFTRRWGVHLALWATLAILVALMAGGPRSSSTGFGIAAVTPLDYARTQFRIIVHYLRLFVIPHPLVLDYGWRPIPSWGPAAPWMVAVLALLGATAWALRRRPAAGYLGAWFFAILAPSSTIVPIGDLAFEHRMYLPLAALTTLVAAGAAEGLRRTVSDEARRRRIGMLLTTAAALACVTLTLARNHDYRSSEAIWRDVTLKRPENPRGHNNLGIILQQSGRNAEARDRFERAIALRPAYADAHFNLGNVWADLGQLEQAVPEFEEALRLQPNYWQAHINLAAVSADLGRFDVALAHVTRAVRLKPLHADAHNERGMILARMGRLEEAIREFMMADQLRPGFEHAKRNLERARALLQRRGARSELPPARPVP